MIPLLDFSSGPSLRCWAQGASCSSWSSQEEFTLTTTTKIKVKKSLIVLFLITHPQPVFGTHTLINWHIWLLHSYTVQHFPLHYALTYTDCFLLWSFQIFPFLSQLVCLIQVAYLYFLLILHSPSREASPPFLISRCLIIITELWLKKTSFIKIHTELYIPSRSSHKTAFQNWKKPHPKPQTLENWLTTLPNPTVLYLDMKSHRSGYSSSLPKRFPWILRGQHKEEIVLYPFKFILLTPKACWWPERSMSPTADSKNAI